MAIKKYKPTTNGRRGMTTLQNEEITKKTPEKSLVVTIKKQAPSHPATYGAVVKARARVEKCGN